MNFTSKDYLPNSEERIEHLRKIINGRPAAIFAAGPSIKELEDRIGELRHANICYIGLNRFFVQEKYILRQIDKHFSVGILPNSSDMRIAIKYIIDDFLNRDEDNMLISQHSSRHDAFGQLSDFDLHQFINKYDKKLLFVSASDGSMPNSDNPLHFVPTNTLSALIQLMIIGKASKIVLFGADGCYTNTTELYYRQNEYSIYGGATVTDCLNDLQLFNYWVKIMIPNIYNVYNIMPIDIINCSENSLYTPFPKISYDKAFEILNDNKNKN